MQTRGNTIIAALKFSISSSKQSLGLKWLAYDYSDGSNDCTVAVACQPLALLLSSATLFRLQHCSFQFLSNLYVTVGLKWLAFDYSDGTADVFFRQAIYGALECNNASYGEIYQTGPVVSCIAALKRRA